MELKLFILLLVTFIINIPAGYFRENFKRMSWQWLAVLHSPIPFVIILRITFDFGYTVIPFLVLAAISGQLIGGRPVRRYIQSMAKENENL